MADVKTLSAVCVLLTYLLSFGNCVPNFPEPLKEFNLLHYSEVTSSGQCSSNGIGYTCNSNKCRGRSATLQPQNILKSATPASACDTVVSNTPFGAVQANGQLRLAGTESENCTMTKTLSNVPLSYSLSLWIRQKCSSW